jgi:PadR family transcriptional regulator, regulatory protein PadR
MPSASTDRELKKGAADLLVLSLLAERQRHGYELSRLIEQRSAGSLTLHLASLYTLLYRLERKGWIAGRWVEKPGERRRRFYRLTPAGRALLGEEQERWLEFVKAVSAITGLRHA